MFLLPFSFFFLLSPLTQSTPPPPPSPLPPSPAPPLSPSLLPSFPKDLIDYKSYLYKNRYSSWCVVDADCESGFTRTHVFGESYIITSTATATTTVSAANASSTTTSTHSDYANTTATVETTAGSAASTADSTVTSSLPKTELPKGLQWDYCNPSRECAKLPTLYITVVVTLRPAKLFSQSHLSAPVN